MSGRRSIYLSIVVAVVMVIGSVALLRSEIDFAQFASWGYFGVFLVTAIGNATLFLPVPGIAAVFAAGAFLNPVGVALAAGLGSAIGETVGYVIGQGGGEMAANTQWYPRIEQWFKRYGGIAIFVLAVIPNPLFDMVGLVAGAAHYPVGRFILATFLGKTLRSFILAWLGGQVLYAV
jgi:membrane protein DedA with SNARE-associated domain